MSEQPTTLVPTVDVQTAVLETYATHTDHPWRTAMAAALAPPIPPVPATGVAVNMAGMRFVRVATHRGGGIWRHMGDNGKLGATYPSWVDLVTKEPGVVGLVKGETG